MEKFAIAPDLSVSVEWSYRMQEIWKKYYSDLLHGRPCTDEQLRWEYNLWQQQLKGVRLHIQRFFELTGNLPIIGDLLQVRVMDGEKWNYAHLSVDARSLFTCASADGMLVIYEMQSTFIDLLEFQAGRLDPKPGQF